MARSSILVVVACLVIATGSASAALTAPQIVSNINALTQKSRDIIPEATKINILSAVLLPIGQGPFPNILRGFQNIITTGTIALTGMQGTATLSSGDCQLVANAFRDFVTIHQQLLNILIGKAGLLSTVPLVGQPVANILRQIERLVDALADNLISIAEGTCSADIAQQKQSFDVTANAAVSSYEGLVTVNP